MRHKRLHTYETVSNIQNKEGFTPLHFAVVGYIPKRIPMALLSEKTRIDIKSKNGLTPLAICRKNRNWEVEELLLNFQKGSLPTRSLPIPIEQR